MTEERKRLWSVLLDLLNELQRVCDKYDLKVIANSGTLLGAVRHSGFIPWDNDIDVNMFRDDYIKLRSVAKREFGKDYFFQDSLSDDLIRGHAQLRKNNTTMMLLNDYRTTYHKGVFIDIFILDYVPDDKKEFIKFRRSLARQYRGFFPPKIKLVNRFDHIKKTFLKICWNLLIFPFAKLKFCLSNLGNRPNNIKEKYSAWDVACSKYNHKTKHIANISFSSSTYNKVNVFDECSYKELIKMKFENLEILVPKRFDYILRKQYGDYRKFVVGNEMHGKPFIDLYNSYKKYENLPLRDYRKLFN